MMMAALVVVEDFRHKRTLIEGASKKKLHRLEKIVNYIDTKSTKKTNQTQKSKSTFLR